MHNPIILPRSSINTLETLLLKTSTLQLQKSHYNDRLCDHLTAYRKRHSCKTVLLYLTESWRHSLDNGECVGVLSTDMSKAFDCLFPPLMLAKLRAYSFDDVSLKLMASYFENRQARVKLVNTTSGWRKVERGCPQGSSFGPLMWNLYQNDLTYVMKSNISMYADDHQKMMTNKITGECSCSNKLVQRELFTGKLCQIR